MPRGRESDTATSEAVVDMSDTTALPVAAGEAEEETVNKSVELEDGAVSFPHKLHEILSEESNHDIIAWLPHGKGFHVVNKKRFAGETLPRYFSKKSKFTSFTRKLNRWNFTRVTRGPEAGAYYHALFQRDDPKMVSQMTCINSKSPQQLQPMDPVALGLTTPTVGQYQWPSDPAEQARAGQYWQQWMSWFQAQQKVKKEGEEEEGGNEEAATTDEGGEDKKPSAEGEMPPQDMQAMMAAWQYYQYYSMSLWQQQQQNPPNSPFPPPPSAATATAAAAAMMDASTAAAVDAATAAVAEAAPADAPPADAPPVDAMEVEETAEEGDDDKKPEPEAKKKAAPFKKQIKTRKG